MKNIFKSIICLTVITLFCVSCDEDETTFDALDFPTDAFVALESTSALESLESSTNPIQIVVNYSNTVAGATSAVSVDFSITSNNAVEGTHYMIADNKTQLNFAPGVFKDMVEIIPIDNASEDGDKLLTFSLAGSSVSLGYPGPDSFGTSLSITLTDDDCAWSLAGLDGIEWIGNDNASGGEGPNATQIVTSFDGTILLMEGIAYGWLTNPGYWDEPVVVSHLVNVDMHPVTGAFTVEFQELCETTFNGVPQTPYQISASGQFLSCLGKMIVNYDLYQGGDLLRSHTETIEF